MPSSNLNSFLGTGWKFPPTFDPELGSALMVSDEEDIQESLNILLSTALGERVMQPRYGCDLQPYLFDPLNANLIGFLKNRVYYAIIFYESRINLINITVSADSSTDSLEGKFRITVTYDITQTNTRFNYVYDYFQNEALQPI
ncbi:MAG TPA: GPW/gp25 family protein [Puia sp.]|nr:GPW/gp25 family protein [Puia sp.]